MSETTINPIVLTNLCQELAKINTSYTPEKYQETLLNKFNLRMGDSDRNLIVTDLINLFIVEPPLEKPVCELAWYFLNELGEYYFSTILGEIWAKTRNKTLGELIRQHKLIAEHAWFDVMALTMLQAEAYDDWGVYYSTFLFTALLKIASDEHETELGPRVLTALNQAARGPQRVVEIMVEAWLETRSVVLLKILEEVNYVPTKQLDQYRLAFELTTRDEVITEGTEQIIELLLKSCLSSESQVAERGLQLLKKITNPKTQDMLCRRFIAHNHLPIREAATERGWQPRKAAQRPLFFFLTGQWAKYDALDFDQRILQTNYQQADLALRRRIAQQIRLSGRRDYLSILTGGQSWAREKELTSEEAAIWVETLANQAEWEQLWQLVTSLPLAQSVAIVQQLQQIGWQPPTAEEQAKLGELGELAAALRGLDFTELAKQQLQSARIQRTRTHLIFQTALPPDVGKGQKIKDIAFSPRRSLLALAVAQNQIVLWNTQTAKVEQIINATSTKSVAFVTFTETDILCWAERSAGGTECCIYRWLDNSLEEVGRHSGPVTSLQPFQSNQLISAGRDGQVILWDVSEKKALATYTLPYAPTDWVRGLALSHDKQQLAVLHNKLTILRLPAFRPLLKEISLAKHSPLQKGIFSPNDQSLLIFKKGANTHSVDLRETGQNYPLFQPRELADYARQGNYYLPGAITIPELDLVLMALDNGQLYFWDCLAQKASPSAEVLNKTFKPAYWFQNCVTLIRTAPGLSYLGLADADGQLFIYDLRLLVLHQIFTRPLAVVIAGRHFAVLKRLREEYLKPELAAVLRYVEVATTFRIRYAIELEELGELEDLVVQPGDFDIELTETPDG